MSADSPRAMVCQEVAGGNVACERGLTLPGLETWVITRPYQGQAGGGDVHYVSSCATGRIARLLLADVSGHGQRVVQTSTALRDIMRRNVNFVDQQRVVRALNQEFSGVAGGRFATAIVATFWEPSARLVLCNAGHPRPLLRRRGDSAWTALSLASNGDRAGDRRTGARLDGGTDRARGSMHEDDAVTNLPLGIEELTRYEQMALRLAPGDDLLLYTDALIEVADQSGRQLGEAGLIDLLRARRTEDPARFLRALLADLTAWVGGSLGDDATAMLIRRTRTRPSFLTGLAAPLRIAVSAANGVARAQTWTIPWPQLRADNILGPFLPWLNGRRRDRQ